MAQTALNRDEPVSTVRAIRDPEFAKRFNRAADDNPLIPPHNHGRLGWVQREMLSRFGARGKVSIESIRRWFAGEVKPTTDKIDMLAELLSVDPVWLNLGVTPALAPREQKLRNATADGAVNLVCGLIQMAGGHPAFPEPNDTRAKEVSIDLYAIIKGAQYRFHVALGQSGEAGAVKFVVPVDYDDVFQIGVIQTGEFAFRLVEIPAELLDTHGHRKGAAVELTMPPEAIDQWEVKSFRNRL